METDFGMPSEEVEGGREQQGPGREGEGEQPSERAGDRLARFDNNGALGDRIMRSSKRRRDENCDE